MEYLEKGSLENMSRQPKRMKSWIPVLVVIIGILLNVIDQYCSLSFKFSWITVNAMKTLFLPIVYLVYCHLKCNDLRLVRSFYIICWIALGLMILEDIFSLLCMNLGGVWLSLISSLLFEVTGAGRLVSSIYVCIKCSSYLWAYARLGSSFCIVVSYVLCLIGFTGEKHRIQKMETGQIKNQNRDAWIPILLCLIGFLFNVIIQSLFYFLNDIPDPLEWKVINIFGLRFMAGALLIPTVYYLCRRLNCINVKLINVMIILCSIVLGYQVVYSLVPGFTLFPALEYMDLPRMLYTLIMNIVFHTKGNNYLSLGYARSICFAAAEVISLSGFVKMKRKAVKGMLKRC